MKQNYVEPLLIADDIEVNVMLLKNYVQKNFSTIFTAKNGVEAYNLAKEMKFICIIMDIQMPIINGLDATELIRKKDDSLNKETPIIGITASSRVNYELLCLERGMNSVLFKPVTRDMVLQEIDKVISGSLNVQLNDEDSAETDYETMTKYLPFEYKKALEEFAGDEQLLNMAVTQFSSDLRDQMKTMQEAIELKNFETVHKIAHKIRGAAANMTAIPISEIAGQIEENEESIEDSEIDNQMFLLNERVTEFLEKVKQLKIDL